MLMQHLLPTAAGAAGISGLGAATYFDPESWQRNVLLGLGTVGAARGTSAAMRSNPLADYMIRRSAAASARRSVGNPLAAGISPATIGALLQRSPQP
jgi:hypothetical protein